MINARCYTNLDRFKKEKWPWVFLDIPRKGDCVKAESGAILKICRITHATRDIPDPFDRHIMLKDPIIEIELHKTV